MTNSAGSSSTDGIPVDSKACGVSEKGVIPNTKDWKARLTLAVGPGELDELGGFLGRARLDRAVVDAIGIVGLAAEAAAESIALGLIAAAELSSLASHVIEANALASVSR